MSFLQHWLVSAGIFTLAVVAAVVGLLYVQAAIKNKILAGLASIAVSAGCGYAAWVIVRVLPH